MSLAALKPGMRAVIMGFDENKSNRLELVQRMMEMGLTVGAEVELAHEAPFGGAIAVRCRGSLIALRDSDAAKVEVRVV